MTKTYLTSVSNGTGNAESLETFTDCSSSVSSSSAVLLDCDSSAYCVGPLSVLEADRLNAFDEVINIKTCIFCDLLSLFNGRDSIFSKLSVDLGESSLV